jgi:hypothetical protein
MTSKSESSPTQPIPLSHASDAPDDRTLPRVVEQYQRFLPLAQKLDGTNIRSMRIPAALDCSTRVAASRH